MRRLAALIKKEVYQILRDPSSLIIAVILPCILLFFYGYGVSLDTNRIKIGMVVLDTSPEAQSLIQAFKDTKYFSITFSDNRAEIEKQIMASKLRGMVVIPVDFTQRLLNPHDASKIQVIADGSETNTAAFVQNYSQAVINLWYAQNYPKEVNTSPSVIIQPRYWFNSELKSNYFLLPGAIATIMTLIGVLLTSLVIAREWERGTMEALMATPVTMPELIFGKLIPYFVLGMTSMVICTLAAITIFGVPFRGSFILLLVVSAVFLITALEWGLLISTATKNQFIASQAALITAYLPTFILSGFIFEIRSMPAVIQFITNFVPAKYFVGSLQTLFLAGNVYGVILPDLAVLSVFALLLCLGYRRN
ncbi:MAG TPA: ABC transporter permease, partial [Bacteroidales bacterium]|nr:ABC transporter permease [Bacteroidales bacterium]